ncbi:MAG: hypothetical protein IJT41_10200, partial [Clostridia bacterium]|nr:hypothetical protein [Clostridia bacterium]
GIVSCRKTCISNIPDKQQTTPQALCASSPYTGEPKEARQQVKTDCQIPLCRKRKKRAPVPQKERARFSK